MNDFTKNYNYAVKRMTEAERNKVWASIRTDNDVMFQLRYANNVMNQVLNIQPQHLRHDDIHDVERALGELEIAIKRIHTPELYNLFSFNEDDRERFIEEYQKYETNLNVLYQRKMAW